MKRILILVSLALLVAFASVYGLFLLSKSRSFQFFGEIINRVDTTSKVVALTFDDGPSDFAPQILDVLREKNIVATFYVIGEDVEKNPQLLKSIVDEGHQIGNHSYNHPRFYFQSQDEIQYQIETTHALIRDSGYDGEITFRPPYGKKLFGLPWYLKKQDIKTITWDVEPDTFYPGDKDRMVKYVLETVSP